MANRQNTEPTTGANVTPIRGADKPPASAEFSQIGKKGAITYDEGVLKVEHPTWMNAIGTEYVNLSEVIAEQMVILSASNGNKVDQHELSLLTETVMGISPKDHVEMMLATQMAAVHLMSMNMAAKARRATTLPQHDSYTKQTNQLMRTFAAQAEALKRYRTGGKQVVKVKHVHVHEGGQAIVGNVTKGGGGE
ncbi:hypothetical protein NXC12_CH00518 [Rhizobium etli]|uniref:Uncharacterized protein n=1 Tax=Rhizobium etli TaxID=29449 RepID=A0AAN1EIA7_RHIET|nr:hypothetical protein [Rhizobium etli]ARQ08609.1 hypothetical protein NXC12_CH00518 [Rhizobium etli]